VAASNTVTATGGNAATAAAAHLSGQTSPVDEMQSSCLSIAKMILFNIALLLKEVSRKFNKQDDTVPGKLVIDESQLSTLVDLLTDFEDNGDLV